MLYKWNKYVTISIYEKNVINNMFFENVTNHIVNGISKVEFLNVEWVVVEKTFKFQWEWELGPTLQSFIKIRSKIESNENKMKHVKKI